ncbi:MAG: glycoside hydrolase family 3 C-terminal domain-containing protein [Lachnospiraceae bacterium]|nr:glycoside hydrolase family 3 C-terminal domain-containing protein [Lachnospiraceae bacterium]
MKFTFDWKEYAKIAREAAAEGCVLLKNDSETLPLKKGEKVALFGRTQFDYIKSGTGSGGLVNTPYVVNIYEGLKASESVTLDENIADIYRTWLKDHPFDKGVGWAGEPFSQVEMPLDEKIVEAAAKKNGIAIACIGRLAGEDKDNTADEGSFLLRADERDMLRVLTKYFKKVCVLINSGNIIDMKWVKELNPSAVLYIWQGGVEGGNATADVITGKVNPSGRLADTIAQDIKDYPCEGNFGDPNIGIYAEDIFVGYRYFETFAKDKVLYPFGFGLSYTTFSHSASLSFDGENVDVTVTVKNTGNVAGKEAVQVYFKAPTGELAKPERELIGFAKTGVIPAGSEETVKVSFKARDMASFDDDGYTGHENCFVLEKGDYTVFEGANVRDAVSVGSINLNELIVTEELSEALAPIRDYKRMTRDKNGNLTYEPAPKRKAGPMERRAEEIKTLKDVPYVGSQKYKLKDVKDGKITIDEFISGLSTDELIAMTRGEGMCSPRVTSGTAAAFAGVTDELNSYGIPALCCSDGPSGIRMDSGTRAMQVSNGTSLACTFNTELITKVYEYLGKELRLNKIDSLLGPGMNIHRSPLNGRNFEYFSEDPRLTGAMAVAELKGMHKYGVTGMIKHFSCNNQEKGRHTIDSVVSKRALREIYLKGYEMAVKEGGAYLVMTTYGSLNGTHTAGSYDQNETVLRKEWGFKGITGTDWWAVINDENGEASRTKTSFMIRGANDVYMCTTGAKENGNGDDSAKGLEEGIYTRAELVRNVRRILTVAMNTVAFERMNGAEDEITVLNEPKSDGFDRVKEIYVTVNGETAVDESIIDTSKGTLNKIRFHLEKLVPYTLVLEAGVKKSDAGLSLAQIPMAMSLNGISKKVVSLSGDDTEFREVRLSLENFMNIDLYLGLAFGQDGMVLRNIRVIEDKQ